MRTYKTPPFAETGRYRSGQTGRTVNPLAFAFAGSNPALPILPATPPIEIFEEARSPSVSANVMISVIRDLSELSRTDDKILA